jgi:hypothetical protein
MVPRGWSQHTLTALGLSALVCCSLNFGSSSSSDQGCSAVCFAPAQGPAPEHATSTTTGGCTTWACDPGWTDCGGGACSTDVTTDPKNCGDCGNVCANGTCAMGSCQPVDTLASGISQPGNVVVDSANVYFAAQNPADASNVAIESVPLGGGATQIVAVIQGPIEGFAADDSGVYTMAENPDYDGGLSPITFGVLRVQPLSVTSVAPEPILTAALAASGGYVWWLAPHLPSADGGIEGSDEDAGSDAQAFDVADSGPPLTLAAIGSSTATDLVRAAEANSVVQVVATAPGFDPSVFAFIGGSLAVSGAEAFFPVNGTVFAVRADASTAEALATDTQPITSVSVDDTFVYWNAQTSQPWEFCILGACEDAGPPPPPPELRRVPRAGGTVQTLAAASVRWLTASAGLVWDVESGQAGDDIVRRDGSGKRTVLSGGIGSVQGLAVDATSVYWTLETPSGQGLLLRTNR